MLTLIVKALNVESNALTLCTVFVLTYFQQKL